MEIVNAISNLHAKLRNNALHYFLFIPFNAIKQIDSEGVGMRILNIKTKLDKQ